MFILLFSFLLMVTTLQKFSSVGLASSEKFQSRGYEKLLF